MVFNVNGTSSKKLYTKEFFMVSLFRKRKFLFTFLYEAFGKLPVISPVHDFPCIVLFNLVRKLNRINLEIEN